MDQQNKDEQTKEVTRKKRFSSRNTTRKIALTSVMVALTFILSLITRYIPFLHFPQGGSVSLEGLGITTLGLFLGPVYGLVGGLVYGFIDFMMNGFIIHWGSIFFDYLLAFGSFGLIAGLFSRSYYAGKPYAFFVAAILGIFAKYLFSSFSGVLFFAEYAGDKNVWLYSFILYNLPYNAGSLAAVLLSGGALYLPFKDMRKELNTLLN